MDSMIRVFEMERWSQLKFEEQDLPTHRDWREGPTGACRGLVLCVPSGGNLFVDELSSCVSETLVRLRLGGRESSSSSGLRVMVPFDDNRFVNEIQYTYLARSKAHQTA